MKIISFLTDPPVVRDILLHLDIPHRPPPLSPARGPPLDPQADFLFDQSVDPSGGSAIGSSPPADPTLPCSVPDFVFDQSVPDHGDLMPEEPDGPVLGGDPETDDSTEPAGD